MGPWTRRVRIVLAAFMGALAGFVLWLAVVFVAIIIFMHGCPSPDEMGLAKDVIPRHDLLVPLVALGAIAGGYLGWRSSRRRQTYGDTS